MVAEVAVASEWVEEEGPRARDRKEDYRDQHLTQTNTISSNHRSVQKSELASNSACGSASIDVFNFS